MSEGDKRHGDPEHGGLTSGEKSAISRAVKEGREIHFTDKHPEHAQAAEEYRKEVEAQMKSEKGHGGAHQGHAHHAGELSGGEKAAVHRYVNEGKDVSELPFCQGHRKKMEQAKAYAEELKKE